ncbi:hypothetical protein [Halomonas organivorans]|uniref:Uncharacterized protein n=1 Tax=Halomonas organivorans TaxID=257772 RepID=A0A7W5G6P2_9GAMM|nr:hypothetical protein [Halomonas organivorans]MBB3142773.1 hypothetical protein [Halomonas organivorans]
MTRKELTRLTWWVITAIGYVIAWPFWKLWQLLRGSRDDEEGDS